MLKTQVETLHNHACALNDLAAQMRRYIDESDIPDTYPAPALVLRQLLEESKKRAELLIDLGNELAGD